MAEDNTPQEHQSSDSKPQMPFHPASNPFEDNTEVHEQPTQATTAQQPIPSPPTKESSATRGIFSLGRSKKKEEEKKQPQQFTPANINGQETTLVGQKPKEPEEEKPQVPEQVLFSWRAPEFVYTNKPVGWFVGLGAFIVLLIVIAIFTRQWIGIVVLALMGIVIGIWANRKPRTLEYKISNYGVVVENKKYLFDDFKAFYEIMDYNQKTVDLVPAKRFGTLVSLPLATADADEIEDVLSKMIPKIIHTEDPIERLTRKLRF